MYDGNPVHIHTGRYPRGIDVSNFKWKFEYFVPEERFSGGGVQIWRPFVSYLYVWYTYLREQFNLVKFNFVEKGGQPGKEGSRRRVPVKRKAIEEISSRTSKDIGGILFEQKIATNRFKKHRTSTVPRKKKTIPS